MRSRSWGVGFADAEDAVQEALVRAWSRARHGEGIIRLDAWVTVTAWNLSRSGIRRLGAERGNASRLASPKSRFPGFPRTP